MAMATTQAAPAPVEHAFTDDMPVLDVRRLSKRYGPGWCRWNIS